MKQHVVERDDLGGIRADDPRARAAEDEHH
jgi:hypothetical protein